MDQPTNTHDSNPSGRFAISFGVLGAILLAIVIFCCCCRTKSKGFHNDRRSSSGSIQSVQQLYFSKTPFAPAQKLDQRVIERWSSVTDPSMTFYRVHMQDNPDHFYQPVNEERLRSSVEQSKAVEYAGLEVNFF